MSHQLVHLLDGTDGFTAVCSCSWTSEVAPSPWDAGSLWGLHRVVPEHSHGRASAG
jgi:hypothetical protein